MEHMCNKIIVLLCVISFLFPCQGDTNLDASINIQDVVLVVSSIISDSELIGEAFNNSDINNDEVIPGVFKGVDIRDKKE